MRTDEGLRRTYFAVHSVGEKTTMKAYDFNT